MNIEHFWAQPATEDDEPRYYDPLASIADSLHRIAQSLDGTPLEPTPAEGTGQIEPTPAESTGQIEELERALEELEARYEALDADHRGGQALIDEVLAVCKPSVGKLAIKIREVLTPQGVEEAGEPEAAEGADEPEEAEVSADEPESLAQPADDAPVEEWRAYAMDLKHWECGYVPTAASEAIASMNRSGIRSILGIEHPGVTA